MFYALIEYVSVDGVEVIAASKDPDLIQMYKKIWETISPNTWTETFENKKEYLKKYPSFGGKIT